MEQRLSRWGIGPKTLVPSVLYTLAAWAGTRAWPEVFRMRSSSDLIPAAGYILTALGVLFWLLGIATVMKAYGEDRLVTSGIFAVVRHPVYAGWITLIFPGLALVSRSWLMLLTPVVGYLIFKRLVHIEDEYLERRFGQPYRDYRARVNEVIPIPRFW